MYCNDMGEEKYMMKIILAQFVDVILRTVFGPANSKI